MVCHYGHFFHTFTVARKFAHIIGYCVCIAWEGLQMAEKHWFFVQCHVFSPCRILNLVNYGK
uniref:Uncharacterized protein n=1 Tax=Aegilops tauschii subsp. strangulata TaxID=200361 RepID=A0A453JHF3_AEGTS